MGTWEWCWGCGAIRRMVRTGPASCAPETYWTKPTDPDGKNPWPMRELKRSPSTVKGEL